MTKLRIQLFFPVEHRLYALCFHMSSLVWCGMVGRGLGGGEALGVEVPRFSKLLFRSFWLILACRLVLLSLKNQSDLCNNGVNCSRNKL